jgi:hypothetical protein
MKNFVGLKAEIKKQKAIRPTTPAGKPPPV